MALKKPRLFAENPQLGATIQAVLIVLVKLTFALAAFVVASVLFVGLVLNIGP